jgi:hypothetical protein
MSSRWWLRVGLNSGICWEQGEREWFDSEPRVPMVKGQATLL